MKNVITMTTFFVFAVLMGALALGQVRQGSWTPVVESMERGYSSISYWTYRDDGVEIGGGRISVEHGRPAWPDGLADKSSFDKATVGKLWRLGNNKWATLDTNLPLHFGDISVEPDIYYLAIERPHHDDWRLAFISPKAASSNLIDAWAAQARPKEVPILFSVPLRYGKSNEVDELEMSFSLEEADMSKGWLRIHWGPHRLETEIAIDMVSPTFYRTKEGTK